VRPIIACHPDDLETVKDQVGDAYANGQKVEIVLDWDAPRRGSLIIEWVNLR
jgi:flagellar biosynthesis/type III secretory pathway protein FliH